MEIRKAFLPVLFCSCIFAAPSFAGQNPDTYITALRNKIVRLIDKPDLTTLSGDQFTAEIEFIVTRKNEVLVIGVNTDNAFFDTYIKGKLNYSRIKIRGVQQMTPYRIEVNFQRPAVDESEGEASMAVVSWR